MAAKKMEYDSVAERFLVERDPRELIRILLLILEDMHPGFFEEGVNKLFPRADGEPHAATYTKPQ